MRNTELYMTVFAVVLTQSLAFAQGNVPTCREMDEVAKAVANTNGASYASPTYRLMVVPTLSERGAEFSYLYDSKFNGGDEQPAKIVGRILVKALVRTGANKCVIESLEYHDANSCKSVRYGSCEAKVVNEGFCLDKTVDSQCCCN